MQADMVKVKMKFSNLLCLKKEYKAVYLYMYLEDQEISGKSEFSPNRKVLLAVSTFQFILPVVISFLKCTEIGFVLPDGNDILYYFVICKVNCIFFPSPKCGGKTALISRHHAAQEAMHSLYNLALYTGASSPSVNLSHLLNGRV
jgi:hypothetical protein